MSQQFGLGFSPPPTTDRNHAGNNHKELTAMPYKSRFSGAHCARCNGTIEKGDAIDGEAKGTIPRRWWHVGCASLPLVEPSAEPELTANNAAAAAVFAADLGDPAPAPAPYKSNSHAAPPTHGAAVDLLDVIAAGLKGRLDLDAKIDPQELDALRDNSARMLALIESLSDKIHALETVRPLTVRLDLAHLNKFAIIENAHKQIPQLTALIARRHNVYLWDSTGGGKTHAIRQVAEALGLRCAAVSFSRQSPVYWITGYMDANGNYVPSTFYNYYKDGGIYDAEEADDASADLLVTLNVAIDNGCMTFANGELVQRHPNFVFVGCGNTAGRGASPRYPERKPFDAAFANRLKFLRWNYDETLERNIALAINPKAQPWIDWTRAARIAATELALRLEITPRTTFTLAELALEPTLDTHELLALVMAGIDQASIDKLLARAPFPERQV